MEPRTDSNDLVTPDEMIAAADPKRRPLKIPVHWRWALWEKSQRPHSVWVKVVEFTADFVFATKDLLARLQPGFDRMVCKPGEEPPQ